MNRGSTNSGDLGLTSGSRNLLIAITHNMLHFIFGVELLLSNHGRLIYDGCSKFFLEMNFCFTTFVES